MVENEQVRPLAPAADRRSSDDAEAALHLKTTKRRKCLKCCGCVTASLLIPIIVLIILFFTVFIKDPVIKMNGVTVIQLELVNGTNLPKPGVNITVLADVSVKNPNVASFRYSNTTTSLYYHGQLVGEARNGPGRAKARKTMRMNVTVDIMPDRLMSSPNLTSDFGSGVLPMTTYSRVPGKMKIVVVKKHIVVKMNCSMALNITSREIHTQKCKRDVDFF